MANRPNGLWHIEFRCHRAITHRGPNRDRWQRRPHFLLKRRASNTPFDFFEPVEIALEIARQRRSEGFGR